MKKFYITEEDAGHINEVQNNKSDYEIIFARNSWSTCSSYEVTHKIRKISREPFQQKFKNFWNNFVELFKI